MWRKNDPVGGVTKKFRFAPIYFFWLRTWTTNGIRCLLSKSLGYRGGGVNVWIVCAEVVFSLCRSCCEVYVIRNSWLFFSQKLPDEEFPRIFGEKVFGRWGHVARSWVTMVQNVCFYHDFSPCSQVMKSGVRISAEADTPSICSTLE